MSNRFVCGSQSLAARTFWLAAICVLVCSYSTAQAASPIPWIATPLAPTTVAPGAAGFTLTVNGTGFSNGATVYWNGSSRVTTFVSSAQVTAQIAAADVATATSASVTVQNPGGKSSLPALFTVTPSVSAYWFGSAGFGSYLYAGYAEVLAGDLNGDGLADLVDSSGTLLQVGIGNGDGSFQPAVDYPIPNARESYGAALGDVNNDGKLDVVVGSTSTNSVDTFFGNGDGTFQSALQDFDAPGWYSTLADFNGDGNLDVAYAATYAVGVLWGNGDGTYHPPVTFPLPNSYITSIGTGDFNRDGIPDLVASSYRTVSVLLGLGDGTFYPAVNYTVGSDPSQAAVADFNGDGYPDIAVIDLYTNSFYVMLNAGDGTFAPAVQYQGQHSYSQFRAVGTADLNADGKLDVVTYNATYCLSDCIEVFGGNGDGTFQPGVLFGVRQDRAGSYLGTLAFADFNRDGRLDIFTQTSNGPYVMLQATAPQLTIDQGALSFAAQAVGTQSQGQTVGLFQPGSSAITIQSITPGGDFSTNGQCVGYTLNPGNTYCYFQIYFNPSAAGTRTSTAVVNTTGGDQYISLTGTGTGGSVSLSVSPAALNFGAQVMFTSSSYQTVTLTNIGDSGVNFTGISVTGADSGDYPLANYCGATLAAGASCTVQVAFAPTLRGSRPATLSISDNAGDSPQSVSLSGTGNANSLSATALNFGNVAVGSSSSQTLTLTNVGGAATKIGQVRITGLNKRDYAQTNTCGSSLAAKTSCTFAVTFTPGFKGTRTASLQFTSSGTGKNDITTVPLTGTGK